MCETSETELLRLSRELLESITSGDWETYARLCDRQLSAFEPEARGQLVVGMDFHRYYFDSHQAKQSDGKLVQNTICSPVVKMLGSDVALVTYIRLIQRHDSEGSFTTRRFEETRLWQRQGGNGQEGKWKHVHFHRS